MTRLFDLDIQLLFDVLLMALAVFILFFVLSKRLFEPVRRLLWERQDGIEGRLSESRRERADAEKLKSIYAMKLKEIDKETEQIISEAWGRARKNAAQIEGEAKAEALRIRQQAGQEAELARERMQDEIKQEIIGVASLLAAKVVAANINTSIQEKLMEDALKEMRHSTWQG